MLKKFSFVLIFLVSLTTLPLNASHADNGFRYWGYFQAAPGATGWTAAMTGPSTKLSDGAVEGWSFTASSNDIPATSPMMDPNFADLCGATSEVAGKVRVGLVVDFGPGEIAPSGETPKEFYSGCVVVPTGSVGLDVLKSELPVRADKSGLICGIGGYPATECGVEIDMPLASPKTIASPLIATAPEEENENSRTLAYAGLGLFALVVAIFTIRRRR
jgi:hypothetical protein